MVTAYRTGAPGRIASRRCTEAVRDAGGDLALALPALPPPGAGARLVIGASGMAGQQVTVSAAEAFDR
eukprot:4947872-Prymnesium_polylepis.2